MFDIAHLFGAVLVFSGFIFYLLLLTGFTPIRLIRSREKLRAHGVDS